MSLNMGGRPDKPPILPARSPLHSAASAYRYPRSSRADLLPSAIRGPLAARREAAGRAAFDRSPRMLRFVVPLVVVLLGGCDYATGLFAQTIKLGEINEY